MKPHHNPLLRSATIAASSLALTFAAGAATWQWDGGASTGNWQTANNWNPNAENTEFDGTFASRLNVNGAQALIYTAAEGLTNYGASTARGLVIGSGTAGSGTMTITGGTFSTLNATGTNADVIGNGSGNTGTLNINGGTFIGAAAGTSLGIGGGPTAYLNVNSGLATITTLALNNTNGTINLNGGVLEVNSLVKTAGNNTFNFNGGTYKARSAAAGISGLDLANVRDGGAVIDTNGFNISIGQNLLHSGIEGDAATDGGLTKAGQGVLTLSGSNTYTGNTTISSGVLAIAGTGSLPGWDANGKYSVAGGASLVVGNAVADGDIATMLGTTNFAAGSAIGLDTTAGGRTYSGNLADTAQGALGLTKLGSNTLTLSGNNTYTGTTMISAGAVIRQTADGTTGDIVVAADNVTFALDGGITDGAGQTLYVAGRGATASNSLFSGSAVQRGALQALNGASTWEGNIVITATGSTSVPNRIGVQDGASLTLTGAISEGVTGAHLLFRAGATGDDITLGGAGSYAYTGETQMYSTGGSIILGTTDKLPAASRLYMGSGGSTLFDLNGHSQEFAGLSGNTTAGATITNNGSAPSILTSTVPGATTAGFPGLITDGNNTVSFVKDGDGTQQLSAPNTYTGTTTVNAGRLEITGNQPATGDVIINGGSVKLSSLKTLASGVNVSIAGGAFFYLDGSSQTVGKLEGAGTVDFTYTAAGTDTLTVGGNDASSTFDGVIQQSTPRTYALTKTGAGTLTLTGANTYTGATTVSGGVLAVNGSLANTTTTVANGGRLAGSGSIGGAVTIELGGTLAAGNSIGSLATGTLALNAGSTFAYEIDNGALAAVAGDLTAVTGDLGLDPGNGAILTLAELGSDPWNLGDKLTLISYSGAWNGGLFNYLGNPLDDDSTINFSGTVWTFNYDDNSAGSNFAGELAGTRFVTMAAIPEPSALLLGGLSAFALLRRRRQR